MRANTHWLCCCVFGGSSLIYGNSSYLVALLTAGMHDASSIDKSEAGLNTAILHQKKAFP